MTNFDLHSGRGFATERAFCNFDGLPRQGNDGSWVYSEGVALGYDGDGFQPIKSRLAGWGQSED